MSHPVSLRQFGIFFDPYYWQTAVLIARSHMTRQYRNSFLGMLWTLLQPLTTLIVYAIVMPMIMRFPAKDYVIYIVCTLPLWGFFSSTLIWSSLSLVTQGETLKRCVVSSTVFPVSDVLRFVYIYLISFASMYLGASLFGLNVSWYALLVPIYLIPVIITIMAISVGIAFIAPYIRDIGEAVLVAMNVMLWFSAVPYPVSVIPEQWRSLMEWNPFYILMRPTIMLAYEGTLPDAMSMIKILVLMVISTVFGYTFYRLCRRNFIYYL